MAKRKVCKLCKVKRRLWEEDNFFGINCRKHFVPLIVLKEHRSELTKYEKEKVKSLITKHYPGWFPDNSIHTIENHWHLHLTKKGEKKKMKLDKEQL